VSTRENLSAVVLGGSESTTLVARVNEAVVDIRDTAAGLTVDGHDVGAVTVAASAINAAGRVETVAVHRTIANPATNTIHRPDNSAGTPRRVVPEDFATTAGVPVIHTSAECGRVAIIVRRPTISTSTVLAVSTVCTSGTVEIEIPVDGSLGVVVRSSEDGVGRCVSVGVHERTDVGITEIDRSHAHHVVPNEGSTLNIRRERTAGVTIRRECRGVNTIRTSTFFKMTVVQNNSRRRRDRL